MYEHIERYLVLVPTAFVKIQRYPGFKIGIAAWVKSDFKDPPGSDICDTVGEALRQLERECDKQLEFHMKRLKYRDRHFKPLDETVFDHLIDSSRKRGAILKMEDDAVSKVTI